MIPWLANDQAFPDVEQALPDEHEAAGLLAAGADLSPQRLLQAYKLGIFPWYNEDQPILWWSTNPRMVLFTDEFKLAHSLKRKLRQIARDPDWQVCFDRDFAAVMQACAAPRRHGPGTWISADIVAAYTRLHQLGYAHSAEVWYRGELVGGAYGMAIGKMFYGESMFAKVSDASKIALAHLVAFLAAQGVRLIDCQQQTAHLASLGARPIPRREFSAWIAQACEMPAITHWQVLAEPPWSRREST